MKDTPGTTYRQKLMHSAKSSWPVRQAVLAAGIISMALGIIGIFIPLLPTTPFLLLAAACFAFSSKRAYGWLLNNRLFGGYIRNYREGRGITPGAKAVSMIFLWLSVGYSTIFFMPYLIGKILLILMAVTVTIHILSRPTFRR